MASGVATHQEGNVKYTANYSVDPSGFGYSIITDDIKADFKFLIEDLPKKLDDAMEEFKKIDTIDTTFEFGDVKDLSAARDELQQDINNLKTSLSELHSAFMTDIDNINYELEYNFGWVLIGEVKGSTRSETVPEPTTTDN